MGAWVPVLEVHWFRVHKSFNGSFEVAEPKNHLRTQKPKCPKNQHPSTQAPMNREPAYTVRTCIEPRSRADIGNRTGTKTSSAGPDRPPRADAAAAGAVGRRRARLRHVSRGCGDTARPPGGCGAEGGRLCLHGVHAESRAPPRTQQRA